MSISVLLPSLTDRNPSISLHDRLPIRIQLYQVSFFAVVCRSESDDPSPPTVCQNRKSTIPFCGRLPIGIQRSLFYGHWRIGIQRSLCHDRRWPIGSQRSHFAIVDRSEFNDPFLTIVGGSGSNYPFVTIVGRSKSYDPTIPFDRSLADRNPTIPFYGRWRIGIQRYIF